MATGKVKPGSNDSHNRVPAKRTYDDASDKHNAEMDRLKRDPRHVQKLYDNQ